MKHFIGNNSNALLFSNLYVGTKRETQSLLPETRDCWMNESMLHGIVHLDKVVMMAAYKHWHARNMENVAALQFIREVDAWKRAR
jgi:hypothetical protein